MSSRARVFLIGSIGSFTAALAGAAVLVLTPVPESEPNNTPATATVLSLTGGSAAMGSLPLNDVDYYSFTAPAGARLWASVDTGASSDSFDSTLTLFGSDGTTQIEMDDDDGIGNNCDATIEDTFDQASTIAGRTLVAGGTYYLRVQDFDPTFEAITSYKLFLVLTTSSSAEVEPNDTSATANSLVTAGTPIAVRNGTITTAQDVDVYSVFAPAGSTLFVSGDGDPEKNGGTDIVVDLIAPDGSTVLFTADSSDDAGSPAPPAESFCFNISTTGTYFVRVRGFQSGKITTTGTYSVMVAGLGIPPTPTPTPTLSPTTIVGGPTPTPTLSPTTIVGGPTATPTVTATRTATVAAPTATRTSTPSGGGPAPSDIPTLSFPMLALLAVGLVSTAFLLLRRL
jgi:Bacterial pre-peptidase C-terminal domain